MTRLDRVLDLLESYDRLATTTLENCYGFKQELFTGLLDDLREKKEKLTKELIEYGCRRKN
jgi:hypothetical protein